MKIFLAGPSAELPRVREAAAQIEAAGHTLTERWWEKVADTGVCASDVDRDEVVLNTAGSANARGISRADAVVLLCRASGGLSPGAAHEAGWAQATDKPVVLVGDPKGHLAPWWPSCGTATVDTVADALEIAGAL